VLSSNGRFVSGKVNIHLVSCFVVDMHAHLLPLLPIAEVMAELAVAISLFGFFQVFLP
jgi:hypothetical protein